MTTSQGRRVELRGVSKSFGETEVLRELDLRVQPGEFVALLGPSGCGKTTALRILAGFESQDRGLVLLDGSDVADVPAHRREIGMMFQSASLFPHLDVAGNIAFGLMLARIPARERRATVARLLEMIGLAGYEQRMPWQLSGGQQQRVALARALALDPGVLLLDEPLSALDARVRASLRDEIRRLQQRLAITTIFVTHDQEEALGMADRVAVMHEGRIEQLASPSTLYQRPATPFVATFVGRSNALAVPAAADVPHVWRPGSRGPVDVLHVRPEALRCVPSSEGELHVIGHRFMGAATCVIARVGNGDQLVQVDMPDAMARELAVGDRVEVQIVGQPALRERVGALA